MTSEQTVLHLSEHGARPSWLEAWCESAVLLPDSSSDPAHTVARALRARPRAIVVDARGGSEWSDAAFALCRRLKRDSFTAIIPVVMLATPARFAAAFAAGADEVLREDVDADEAQARLTALLRRSDRDTDVHPSTRLPGTREIEAELSRRVRAGDRFAACYADLDHFKEFNDRYGYYHGDAVIRLLARILHDVVKGVAGEAGFVGHIGGDDFLFTVPLSQLERVCDDVVQVFDELIPLQYSEADRRAGFFFGKDRRGQLHRVPLMTLSIGVVTNQRRRFTGALEVSELATEMKGYAKTLPGSLRVVDRRRDEGVQPLAAIVGEGVRDGVQHALHDAVQGAVGEVDAPATQEAR